MDHLVGTSVLVGAYALDAMAAAQDRREQLQRAKKTVGKECMYQEWQHWRQDKLQSEQCGNHYEAPSLYDVRTRETNCFHVEAIDD